MAGLNLLTELLIVLGIAVLLLAVAPGGALVVGAVFGLPAWAFHYLTKERLLRWGSARLHHEHRACSTCSRGSAESRN